MQPNFERIAKKLLRLAVFQIIVAVTDRVFGPNAKPAHTRCAELDEGKELPVPGGCGKRRIAAQARPSGIIVIGLFLSQEGITPEGLDDAVRWRKALLEEAEAFDKHEGFDGWATERVRVFVAEKNDDGSPGETLVATEN